MNHIEKITELRDREFLTLEEAKLISALPPKIKVSENDLSWSRIIVYTQDWDDYGNLIYISETYNYKDF